MLGKIKERAKTAKSESASHRPHSFARMTQVPPTTARVAAAANVAAIPANKGRPLRRKGCSARLKTKGRTGRMQGLKIVRIPARKARMASVTLSSLFEKLQELPVTALFQFGFGDEPHGG